MAENMEKIFRDPVCGMFTEDKDTFISYDYKEDTYFFCSDHCLMKFKNDPKTYTKGGVRDRHHCEQDVDRRDQKNHSQIYTCPMHPEVEQQGSGTCPKCGMALEPQDGSLQGGEQNSEYEYMRKRFILGAIITVPLVMIAMREMFPGGHLIADLASAKRFGWWELILSTPAVLWAGLPFYVRGIQCAPDRKYKIRGRSAFAFSDVRRIIAEAALDQDFQSICPVPLQRPKKSFVKTLLRMIV